MQTTRNEAQQPDARHAATALDQDSDAMIRARESLGEVRSATRDLIHQGADVVRERAGEVEHVLRQRAGQVEDAAQRVADRTASYVQEQPLKSLLIATATGALIALAAGFASRR